MKKIISLGCFLISVCTLPSFAQTGILDETFGTGGKVQTAAGLRDINSKIVLQQDGKIVEAGTTTPDFNTGFGDIKLVRYNTDGSIDNTFGTAGFATININGDDQATGIALQSDGKIIVIGKTQASLAGPSDMLVVRFTTSGELDGSFDTDGIMTIDFAGGNDIANGVAIDGSDNIYIAGSAANAPGGVTDYALVSLNANGELNSSFGTNGKLTTDFASLTDEAFGIALQGDGKIIAVGNAQMGELFSQIEFGIVRYNTDGTLDETFGVGGKNIQDIAGTDDFAKSVVIDAVSGKMYVVGYIVVTNTRKKMVIYAGNGDGTTDLSFSTDGLRKLQYGYEYGEAYSVSLQSDGKIVVAGTAYNNSTGESVFTLSRLKNTGPADFNFFSGGRVITTFDNSLAKCYDAIIQPDGNIVVAGVAINLLGDGSSDFALARYLENGILPVTFTSFTAAKNNSSVSLKWQTASEINSSYFSIERSTNGTAGFKEIGRTAAKGFSELVQDYSFEDIAPSAGGNYYRLKQVDLNGQYTYSKTIFLDFSGARNAILVYPNPVKDVINIKGLATDATSTISIINLQGLVLAKTTSANTATFKWDVKQLPVGTYILRIDANKQVSTLKFIKQ